MLSDPSQVYGVAGVVYLSDHRLLNTVLDAVVYELKFNIEAFLCCDHFEISRVDQTPAAVSNEQRQVVLLLSELRGVELDVLHGIHSVPVVESFIPGNEVAQHTIEAIAVSEYIMNIEEMLHQFCERSSLLLQLLSFFTVGSDELANDSVLGLAVITRQSLPLDLDGDKCNIITISSHVVR